MSRASLLAMALFAFAAQAQGQGIEVTLDRNEATTRDQLLLTVSVDGSQRAVPELPELPDFLVRYRGQAQQFVMGGGRNVISSIHSWVLVPRRTGTFTIDPVTVTFGGRTYRSQPLRVRIVEYRELEEVLVTATVSNPSPYVGEQVLYTWRFLRRVQVAEIQLVAMDFEGFLVEDLGKGDKLRRYDTTRSGQQYRVIEIKKALFPQEEGLLTIPPSRIECQVLVEDRERRRRIWQPRAVDSPAIEVNVRPLPAAPGGFSGLVGDFKLGSSLNKRQLRVGESATWKLSVSGTGNAQMIGEPKLPDLSQFKIYDDKPTRSVDRTGTRVRGARSWAKALVPLVAGELTVPAVTLTYFDPQAGSYRKSSTAAVTLEVLPAEGKEELRLTESVAPSTGKVAVRILADDILPLYKGLDAVAAPPFGHRPDGRWLGAVLLPPFLYLALLWNQRRRRHFEANVGLRRQRGALKRAKKALGGVDEASAKGEHRQAAECASRLLRHYVGDKVDLEGSAFTPAEVGAQLRRAGVDEELASETRKLLEKLEAAQFGGVGAVEAERLVAGVGPLLKRLDRQIEVRSR